MLDECRVRFYLALVIVLGSAPGVHANAVAVGPRPGRVQRPGGGRQKAAPSAGDLRRRDHARDRVELALNAHREAGGGRGPEGDAADKLSQRFGFVVPQKVAASHVDGPYVGGPAATVFREALSVHFGGPVVRFPTDAGYTTSIGTGSGRDSNNGASLAPDAAARTYFWYQATQAALIVSEVDARLESAARRQGQTGEELRSEILASETREEALGPRLAKGDAWRHGGGNPEAVVEAPQRLNSRWIAMSSRNPGLGTLVRAKVKIRDDGQWRVTIARPRFGNERSEVHLNRDVAIGDRIRESSLFNKRNEERPQWFAQTAKGGDSIWNDDLLGADIRNRINEVNVSWRLGYGVTGRKAVIDFQIPVRDGMQLNRRDVDQILHTLGVGSVRWDRPRFLRRWIVNRAGRSARRISLRRSVASAAD